tara:strand:+ start:157 stop:498 length:342 start_codon:yes stop_codon:yes gene_type:complete
MHKINVAAKVVLGCLLLSSAALNYYLLIHFREFEKTQVNYRERYYEYISRSEKLWVDHNFGDSDLSLRHPIVIEFAGNICVSLTLNRGSIGGAPVYCFKKFDKNYIEKYDNVE